MNWAPGLQAALGGQDAEGHDGELKVDGGAETRNAPTITVTKQTDFSPVVLPNDTAPPEENAPEADVARAQGHGLGVGGEGRAGERAGMLRRPVDLFSTL